MTLKLLAGRRSIYWLMFSKITWICTHRSVSPNVVEEQTKARVKRNGMYERFPLRAVAGAHRQSGLTIELASPKSLKTRWDSGPLQVNASNPNPLNFADADIIVALVIDVQRNLTN